MNTVRQERLKRIHHNALTARLKILVNLIKAYEAEQPINAVIPGLGDICNMAKFKTLLLDPADDVEVTEGDFNEAMEQLPDLISAWRIEKEAELVSLMSNTDFKAISGRTSDVEFNRKQLELAKAHFYCTSCRQAISYPRILVHACLTAYQPWIHTADPDNDSKIMWTHQSKAPWNNNSKIITFGDQIQTCVAQLLAATKLDIDSTTAQQMDDADFRFECVKCRLNTVGAWVMSWRAAVSRQPSSIIITNPDIYVAAAQCRDGYRPRMGAFRRRRRCTGETETERARCCPYPR